MHTPRRTFLPLLMRGYSYRQAQGLLHPQFNGSGMVVVAGLTASSSSYLSNWNFTLARVK